MGRIQEPVKKAETQANYGSDVIAELLRQLDFKYVALNPGSSYRSVVLVNYWYSILNYCDLPPQRGLHDSLVNHNGNQNPRMLVCLHEEHAIALAHGWAKVTEKPMLCILHANVGIQHASMAIYNGKSDSAH
jgi:thiamine pyrophosphate-dependent acetolactate synthase large subunit-like protein